MLNMTQLVHRSCQAKGRLCWRFVPPGSNRVLCVVCVCVHSVYLDYAARLSGGIVLATVHTLRLIEPADR